MFVCVCMCSSVMVWGVTCVESEDGDRIDFIVNWRDFLEYYCAVM